MKNIIKALSRLDAILLATTVIASSAAGYGAYTSYSSVQQVQSLSSQVSSLESVSNENAELMQTIEQYKKDFNFQKSRADSLAIFTEDILSDCDDYKQQIDELKRLNSYQGQKIGELTDQIYAQPSIPAASTTYYAQVSSTPSTDNTERILYLNRELSYVESQISLCKANYNASLSAAQSTYNSYSQQARQAYVDYMNQKKNSGDTATEQLRLDTAQANQRALGQQASDAQAVIDDLTDTYEDALDALEDYRDEILDELDKLQ